MTDGVRLLLGHASRSPRWDIPKGLAEPDEPMLDAALRELREETGLQPDAAALVPLGVHRYLDRKDLCLFAWRPPVLPDPAALVCASMVKRPEGGTMPELDRFQLIEWIAGLALVGRNMARVLTEIRPLIASTTPAPHPPLR